MPFMVIYRTSDGSSTYEQAEAIDEAALFVERLRNQEGIEQVHLYRMEEISFAFRPYYKVELGMAERHEAPAPGTAEVVEISVPAPEASAAPSELPPPPPPAPAAEDAPKADTEASTTGEPSIPPPPGPEGEPAGANGRRGIFGR
jgi:hypothetical protein